MKSKIYNLNPYILTIKSKNENNLIFKIEICDFKFQTAVLVQDLGKIDYFFGDSFDNINDFKISMKNNKILLDMKIKNDNDEILDKKIYLERKQNFLPSTKDNYLLLNYIINLEKRISALEKEKHYGPQLK